MARAINEQKESCEAAILRIALSVRIIRGEYTMIYRVGDGNNPAYDYSSQLKPAGNAEGQEPFSLEHQKEQASSSKKEEKGEDKKLHRKPGVEVKRADGVRLELSGAGRAEEELSTKAASQTAASGSMGSLWQTVLSVWQTVKDFFYRVWNDETPEIISEDVTPEEAERYTEEYYALKGITPKTAQKHEPEAVSTEESEKEKQAERDARIRKHLRSGDLDQVINLLTDDGKRSVAKNSTLLTYYDRSGQLRQINASDRERILHGDRNVRKL